MAGSREIKAGGAFVEFSLRRAGLERDLQNVAKRIQRFGGSIQSVGKKIAGLGAAITAPFVATLAVFAKVGDGLDKMAARTGVTVEALSALTFAAEQSGSSGETLERGIKGMQRSIVDLGRGLSTQKDAFGALGLTFEDLKDLSPEAQFTLIADRISRIKDPTERAARSMQVFGRSGQELVPLLAGGAAGINAFIKEAEDLGIVIGTDTAKKAAAFTDAMNRVKNQAKAAAVNIGAALAPALTQALGVLSQLAAKVIEFVKENASLIAAVAAGGAALIVFGTAVIGLGTAIVLVGVAIKALVVVVGLLLSPIGLLVAAIGIAGFALLKFTDIGKRAVEFLKTKFAPLVETAKRAFQGITDAFKGGNLLLAVRILWVNLQIAFLEGTQGLRLKWVDFKADFLKTSSEIGIGAVSIFSNMFAKLQTVATNITAAFARAFINLDSDATEAINTIVLLAKKAANALRLYFDPTFFAGDRAEADRLADEQFVAQQKADQKARKSRIDAINGIQNAALTQIEKDRALREQAIAESLAAELAAIQTAADADKARIQSRIDALRNERTELERQARELRARVELINNIKRFLGFGRGAGGGAAIDLEDGPAIEAGGAVAAQLKEIKSAAAGITSSFDIRSLSPTLGMEQVVQRIQVDVQDVKRHIRDIDANLKPGVQPGGLAIT